MGREPSTSEAPRRVQRGLEGLGLACLIATLALLSLGVRIAHADDRDAAAMSVDPELVAEQAAIEAERAIGAEEAMAPMPAGPAGDPVVDMRPGVGGVEIAPGVILLNTSGYNHRPVTSDAAARARPTGVALPPASPTLPEP